LLHRQQEKCRRFSVTIPILHLMKQGLLSLRLHLYTLPPKSHLVSFVLPVPLTLGNYFRSEEHTSELQSRFDLVCRLLLEKKKVCRLQHQTKKETSIVGT